MKQLIILLIAITFNINCYAQRDHFILHPLLGDTIDKSEKLNYFLFPKIENEEFKFCFITHSDNQFFVNTHYINDSVSIQPVDTIELRQYIVHLDKFLAYNMNKEKKDSLNNAKVQNHDFKDLNGPYKNDQLVGKQALKRIDNEVERDNRMKFDAENANLTKNGLNRMGGTTYFQFFDIGLKKKK